AFGGSREHGKGVMCKGIVVIVVRGAGELFRALHARLWWQGLHHPAFKLASTLYGLSQLVGFDRRRNHHLLPCPSAVAGDRERIAHSSFHTPSELACDHRVRTPYAQFTGLVRWSMGRQPRAAAVRRCQSADAAVIR